MHIHTHSLCVHIQKKSQINREKCDAKNKWIKFDDFFFFFFFVGSETQIFINVEMVSTKRSAQNSLCKNPKMKRAKKKKLYTQKDKNNRVESAVFGRGFNLIYECSFFCFWCACVCGVFVFCVAWPVSGEINVTLNEKEPNPHTQRVEKKIIENN